MSDTATRLIKTLLADATVADLVGRRVHQSRVPDGISRPYVWVNRTGTEHDGLLSPTVGADHSIEYFELECWAETLAESQDIAAAVRGVLNNYYGDFDGVRVASIFITDQDDDYLPQGSDDETIFYSGLTAEISYA